MNLPTSSQPSLSIKGKDSASPNLRCLLKHTGDRWQTCIEWFVSDAPPILILESIEGDANTDWPPSPALQDCQHLSSMPDAILATGMAGVAHWSAAIERSSDDQTDGIILDIACRIRKEGDGKPRLQSRYRLGAKVIPKLNSDGSLLLSVGDWQCIVSAVPTETSVPRATISLEEVETAKSTHFTQMTVTSSVPLRPPPQTVRWKYRLGFA